MTHVVTGAKGPILANLAGLESARAEAPPTDLVPREEGEVVYVSNCPNYMILIKPDAKKVIGDIVVEEPHRMVRFQALGRHASEFRTKDPFEIEKLESNKDFGLGKSFWRADQARAIAEEAQYASFLQQIDSNPVLARKLKERLKLDAKLTEFASSDT